MAFKFFIFNLPMTLNEDHPLHSELVALSMQTGPADLVSLAYELHRGTNGDEFGPGEQAVLLFLIYLCHRYGGRVVDLEAEADQELLDMLYSRALSLSYIIPYSLGHGISKTHENAIEIFHRFERLFSENRVRQFLRGTFHSFQVYLALHHQVLAFFYDRLLSEARDLRKGIYQPKVGVSPKKAAFCRAVLVKESDFREFMRNDDWRWFCPQEVQKMGSWFHSIPVLELEDGYWLLSPELVLASLRETYSMLALDLSDNLNLDL